MGTIFGIFFDIDTDIVTSSSKVFLWCDQVYSKKTLIFMVHMSNTYVIAKVDVRGLLYFLWAHCKRAYTNEKILSFGKITFKWAVTWPVSKGLKQPIFSQVSILFKETLVSILSSIWYRYRPTLRDFRSSVR